MMNQAKDSNNNNHNNQGIPPHASRETNRIFVQRHQATGIEQGLEIFNRKYIQITRRNFLSTKTYQLNLSLLEPWPSQQRSISWRWLLSTVYFAITTTAYSVYLYQHANGDNLGRLTPFIFVFILLTLGSLLMFFLRSPHVTVFRSRYCGTVLISLFQNQPNKEEFKEFVEELKNRILAASQALKTDKHKMLLFEFKTLRRLMDEGVLPATELQRAQKRIPNMKAFIG